MRPAQPAHPPDKARSAILRVLIADDHEDMRLLMRLVLLKADCIVVGEASNGDDAILQWRSHRQDGVDLLLLDQRMPGQNGMEVARQVLADDPQVKVIIASAYLNDLDHVEAERLGIHTIGKTEIQDLVANGMLA